MVGEQYSAVKVEFLCDVESKDKCWNETEEFISP